MPLWRLNELTPEPIAEALAENADHTWRIITDEYFAYRKEGAPVSGGYEVGRERVRADVYSNTIAAVAGAVLAAVRRGVELDLRRAVRHVPTASARSTCRII